MVLVLLYVHAGKDGPIANFYLYTRYGVQKSQGLPTQQMNELMNTDHNACILVDDRLPFTTEGIVCRVIQAISPDRTKFKELDKEGGRYITSPRAAMRNSEDPQMNANDNVLADFGTYTVH